MKHFHMGDLETMGTSPGCAIVSIGVAAFNPFADTVDEVFPDQGFYCVVNRDSCMEHFLHEDESTKEWWEKQRAKHPRAAEAVDQYRANKGLPLRDALEQLVDYVQGHGLGKDALLFGNGADFDNPILNVAARMVGVTLPWKWGNRCYRSMKNLDELFGPLFKAPVLTRVGQYHNALDDSKTQALHLWEIVQNVRRITA